MSDKVLVKAPNHPKCTCHATPQMMYLLGWKIDTTIFYAWLCPICDDMWLEP